VSRLALAKLIDEAQSRYEESRDEQENDRSDAMPNAGDGFRSYQIRLAGVESADSKEGPRPASAKPAVASLLPLAASLQFAANVEILRHACAMVGRSVVRLELVRASKVD